MNRPLRYLLLTLALSFNVWSCPAQEPYAVGHYLRDRAINRQVDSISEAGDALRALELHSTIRGGSPGHHFWRAQLAWHAGQPLEQHLRTAFALGYGYTPNSPPDSFDVANAPVLRELQQQADKEGDTMRIKRCQALIDRDQELTGGSGEWDSLAHRATLDTLEALIHEGGWPSSYPLGGIGVAIILAHQHWNRAHQFAPFQALIEQECAAGREDWTVALVTLQQRIRWTARNKTDTIRFTSLTLSDEDPALPMIVAISERLVSNGHKTIWIHAADTTIASTIARRIIAVQPIDDTSPEILEMLKARNFDHPAQVTFERMVFVIDPALARDRFLFRMN